MRMFRHLVPTSILFILVSTLSFGQANHVVISEVYGGGGNSGATWKNDFIELYNPTDSVVSLAGWSVQYASAAGSFGSNITNLSGLIAPHGFFLVQEAAGTGGTVNLPTPDVAGAIAMSGTAAKVALAKKTAAISGLSDVDVVDFVGYGLTANAYEGTGPTPAPSNTTSVERKANSSSTTVTMSSGGSDVAAGNGYDSNNNANDFVTRTPDPQNSASPAEPAMADVTPPYLVSLKILSESQLDIQFNEPVDTTTANVTGNYGMTGGVSIFRAVRDSVAKAHVYLSVSTMSNAIYTLTISNVKDTSGNAITTPQTTTFVVGVLSIADARVAPPGTVVRVRGIITAANEFKSPSFIQDSTGAIGLFSSTFSASAKLGDLWEIAGPLQNFNGLMEITPPTDTIRISSGNPVPAPQSILSSQLGESVEGELVRINHLTFLSSGTFSSGDITASDTAGTFTVRIDADNLVPGSPIPTGPVNVVGIVNQTVAGYQLMPRSTADIGISDPPAEQTWMDISIARAQAEGTPVRVRGIVTFVQSGSTGKTVFLQDQTGGVASYDVKTDTLAAGDSVQIKGLMSQYQNLQEIKTVDSVWRFARGLALPTPLPITAAAGEYYEGRLVILHAVRFVETGTFTANTTFHITDGATQMDIRVPIASPLDGQPIPVSALNLTGVLGQFLTRYQLLPRSMGDLVALPGPQLLSLPSITTLTDTSISVQWTTLDSSNSVVSYGRTQSLTDSVVIATPALSHTVMVGGLTSGRVYWLRAASQNGSGISSSPLFPVVTASSASSGTMSAYFNYPVDTVLAILPKAAGSVRLDAKLLERISGAKHSVDLALYSFDDFSSNPTKVSKPIADSLVAAKNRGVSVRVVVRMGLTTTPLSTLAAASIPIMKRNVPELGSGMHSKFFIIDGRDTTNATDDWVITGSWNVTNTGTLEDAQNAVFIQDQSLARIYEMEFEEMFGSSTDAPNAGAARFGPTKLDDSPHFTFIHGTKVEVYFSPSDHTTAQIVRTLGAANSDLLFALLTVTRSDIASTIVTRKSAGVTVHGLIDNINDQGSQYTFLQSSGADVRQASHSLVSGQFHHKYAVVDPFTDASDPTVITGSHNWSSSAETDNDENTIIIHSGTLARQYAQEFSRRLTEAGGTLVITGVEGTGGTVPTTTELMQNYPNPFNPETVVSYQLSVVSHVELRVYDVLGREVSTLVNAVQHPGTYRVTWNAAGFSSGVYFCKLQAGNVVESRKMLLLK